MYQNKLFFNPYVLIFVCMIFKTLYNVWYLKIFFENYCLLGINTHRNFLNLQKNQQKLIALKFKKFFYFILESDANEIELNKNLIVSCKHLW